MPIELIWHMKNQEFMHNKQEVESCKFEEGISAFMEEWFFKKIDKRKILLPRRHTLRPARLQIL